MDKIKMGMTVAALAAVLAIPAWAATDDTVETDAVTETEQASETATEAETENDEPVELDPITGEPVVVTTAEATENTVTSDVRISSNCIYSVEKSCYVFTDSEFDGEALTANISDYAVTNDGVSVSVNSNLNCELYKDGILVTDPDLSNITEPGDYGVLISGQGIPLVNMLHFTILGEYTNIESIDLQGIYNVQSATLDGEAISVNSSHIDFTEDGEYEMIILNTAMGTSYTVKTNVLRTAPSLKLEAVDDQNVARGAVDISDINPEWTTSIYLDGTLLDLKDKTKLTDSGYYNIILVDKAGNKTTYDFTITLYLDTVAMIFVAIIVALALGAFIYLIIDRKKKKVR